jgi:hypothetical protein
MVSLKVRRTLCDVERDPPKTVPGFAAKCVESRTIKTNLLVWVEAICPKRIDTAIPAQKLTIMGGCTPGSSARAHRFSHKTHTRVMKFPEFAKLFFNRSGKHCADQKSVPAGHD